jgi:serine/threonine protein kinase
LSSTLCDDRTSDSVASGTLRGADELLGTEIDGRYRVEALLGAGGMGLVYRATHTRLRKDLAIKVLRERGTRDPNATARFQREAESASAIGNAHIVDVSDFGTLPDGSTYFVMEYLQGVDLIRTMEAEGCMPVGRACGIAIQLCQALGAAHEAGIVHRDLKPENVFLIERDGNPDFVKVLDFGIAKVAHGPSRLTREADFLGTPHYMSPEQCEGLDIDHRTDIYALGVLLYEMVAARVPHDADTTMALLHKHVYERPTPIELYVPDIPLAFKRIVGRCLEKKPERRYQSMSELQADLERLQQGERDEAPSLIDRWASLVTPRSRSSLATLAVVAVAVVAFFALISESAERPQSPVSVERVAQTVRVEPERGVPVSLARPTEAAPQSANEIAPPPKMLAAPKTPGRRVKAAPPVRGSEHKLRRQPIKEQAPKRAPAQREDVLDPWM